MFGSQIPGHQKEIQQHITDMFSVFVKMASYLSISLQSMLSWPHSSCMMGDSGSSISGAFHIKL